MVSDLDQVRLLTTLKYQKSEAAVAVLNAREAELRAELKRLRDLTVETQSQQPEHAQIRAIGADVIWLRWLGQAQRQLNIALAQVLAEKEGLMAQHRRAHGKKLVAETLVEQAQSAHQKASRHTALDRAITHMVHREKN
ncbi:hypothetical protein [uncultured Tateyamaria sp.]|uniref:hypothetical protein n=1 Tax=uncultured Tateyamaria sp. TaxID=455651 RepID=UPI00263007D0|nr:hypothetical protein [uncultured Tateyamaria sp.]